MENLTVKRLTDGSKTDYVIPVAISTTYAGPTNESFIDYFGRSEIEDLIEIQETFQLSLKNYYKSIKKISFRVWN